MCFFRNFQLQLQGFNLPRAITNLIGTTHTFEVKTSTYFEHGAFESFTCWNIIPADEELKCSSTPQIESTPSSPLMTKLSKKTLCKNPSLPTPMKSVEETKKTVSQSFNTIK